MNQPSQDDEPLKIVSNGTKEQLSELSNACKVILECIELNNINKNAAIGAFVSIALSTFSELGASNKTINSLMKIIEQAQKEIWEKHQEDKRGKAN